MAVYLQVGLQGLGIDEYTEAFGQLDVLRFKYLYVGLPGLDGVEYLERSSDLGVALAALMRLQRPTWQGSRKILHARSLQELGLE